MYRLSVRANGAAALPWAAHHPHVAHWERYGRQNCIYRGRSRLSFAPDLPGAGVFRWHSALTLTQQCAGAGVTRRSWCLPDFFRHAGLTYNQVKGPRCPFRKGFTHLKSAPIGREFVSPAGRSFKRSEQAAVLTWLRSVFQGLMESEF